jgi:hypothetical protein
MDQENNNSHNNSALDELISGSSNTEKPGTKKRYIIAIIFGVLALGLIVFGLMSLPSSKPNDDIIRQAILAGKTRMIGGQVSSIDVKASTFVLDTDPFGDHKIYIIKTNKQTVFKRVFKSRYIDAETYMTEDELDALPEGVLNNNEEKEEVIDLALLAPNMFVDIVFDQPVFLNNTDVEELKASEVIHRVPLD